MKVGVKKVAESVHIGTMINWSEATFAQFAFDLVAIIQGRYEHEPNRVSSFFGMGSSFHELMRSVGAQEIVAEDKRLTD